MTPDTVIDGEYNIAGWNRYAYVSNNPVLYKDPTGHFKEEETYSNEVVDLGGTSKHYYSYHGEVEKGDTLSGIAKKYIETELDRNNVNLDKRIKSKAIQAQVDKMKSINGLTSDKIKPGQKLTVNKYMYNFTEPGLGTPLVDPLDFVPVGLVGKLAYNATSKAALTGAQKLSAKVIATQTSKAITVSTKNGLRLYGSKQLKRTPVNLLKAYVNPKNIAGRKVIGEKVLGKTGNEALEAAVNGLKIGCSPTPATWSQVQKATKAGLIGTGAAGLGFIAGQKALDEFVGED